MEEELEPFSADEKMLRLSLKGAIALKNDFAYLMNERPFKGKDGTNYKWFKLVVAPSDYTLRTKYIEVYYREYPYVNDEDVARMFNVSEFTVLSLMNVRSYDDGILLHGTLISIILERGVSFDSKKYAAL